MPFLPPNQQCQSTEGTITIIITYNHHHIAVVEVVVVVVVVRVWAVVEGARAARHVCAKSVQRVV